MLPVELKTVDSMPGSINKLVSKYKKLTRPPSLSESFAWEPQNIERAYRLLSETDKSEQSLIIATDLLEQEHPIGLLDPKELPCGKYERQIVGIVVKLLFHITLISIFETIFFFLYVSTLENAGIEKTVATFINGAVNGCKNFTQIEVEIVNDLLEPFINASVIIKSGIEELETRTLYNNKILSQAWSYVGGLSGLFILLLLYIKIRKIKIMWKNVILENLAMVFLLATYEYMFFETIIYPYQPITANEIAKNAVEQLQTSCGILTSFSSS